MLDDLAIASINKTMKSTTQREIISRETIKPSSPTPPNLRNYKLSLLDQIAPSIHVSFILFYPNHHHQDSNHDLSKFANRLQQLKSSLSETLTHYYPLAGRIKNKLSVECNDDGVELFECRIDCEMSEILSDPYTGGKLKFLFPSSDLLDMTNHLLVVQVSLFDCGGVAVGVSISHIIGDGSTISTFMIDWAKKTRFSDQEIKITPQFIVASIFPPIKNDLLLIPAAKLEIGKCVVAKRYLFSSSNIEALKDMAVKESNLAVQNPTRVELVTALILESALAASVANSGYLKKTFAFQAVNLRQRMVPPLPEKSMGNIVWSFPVTMTMEKETGFSNLVEKLREGMEKLKKMEVLKFRGEKWSSFIVRETLKKMQNLVKNNNCQIYKFTSWCKFGMYDVDFGWGKAVWMGMGNTDYKNLIVLNDCSNDGDGIEATIILEDEDMAVFERNVDILAHTTPR